MCECTSQAKGYCFRRGGRLPAGAPRLFAPISRSSLGPPVHLELQVCSQRGEDDPVFPADRDRPYGSALDPKLNRAHRNAGDSCARAVLPKTFSRAAGGNERYRSNNCVSERRVTLSDEAVSGMLSSSLSSTPSHGGSQSTPAYAEPLKIQDLVTSPSESFRVRPGRQDTGPRDFKSRVDA